MAFCPILIAICQRIYGQNSEYRILQKSVLWESSFSVRTDGLDQASGRSSLYGPAQNRMLLFRALHELLRVSYARARVISSVALRSGGNAAGVRRNVCGTQIE